jgi:hypothetical protein
MYKNLVIVGFVFISITGLQASNAVPKDNEIPVVKTWSELREAPVFAKGDFGIVRLGIEARQCPQNSGVLLYALVERGGIPSGALYYNHPNALGPLVVNCESEVSDSKVPALQQARLGLSQNWLSRNFDGISKSNEVLYTRIAMVKTKDCQIKIKSPAGKKVSSSIQRSIDSFEPWSSMSLKRQASADGEIRVTCEMQFGADAIEQAMPIHNGFTPQFAGKKSDGEEPLPKLWPAKPSKTLKLVASEGGFLLQSDSSIEVSNPEGNLLVRLWVNGEFVPPKASAVSTLKNRTGKMIDRDELRIMWDRDCFQGVAKAGDRIGMQLLHVPQGWSGTGDQHSKMHLTSRSKQRPAISRMTNRIDFTLE